MDKVKKEACNEKEDLYIGTYYVSPYNKKDKNYDFFAAVNEEVIFFRKKGTVLLQGDLNARTGEEKDYIESDKTDTYLCVENLDNQNIRNSEDKHKNPRGNELLDICKLNDMLVLNGRTAGDIFGKYTCHKWNGSSAVDYFLSPNDFCNKISNFTVEKYIPWLSDHCMIKTTILLNDKLDKKVIKKLKTEKVHPGFIWNENTKAGYQNNLLSLNVTNKINDLLGVSNLTPLELATEIKSILLKNAETSNLKLKKVKTKGLQQSEPWFDSECRDMKAKLSSLGKKLRKSPGDQTIRESLFQEKRKFRKVTLAKKRRYKKNILSQLEIKKHEGNQKEFWKIFRKISPKNKLNSVHPPLVDFFEHFNSISNTNRPQDIPLISNENGPLDFDISLKELENACNKLKLGKACGFDDICNEMIISLINTHPKIVLKLFNDIFKTGEVIPEWVVGMIVPIHKDGAKLDTSNYRGITLISCLCKLFISILNTRLLSFTKNQRILADSQLGFVPGNRTSDAHILIHNLVRKVCHKNNSKIYSCFVDFKKAFDSIPRDILLKKLEKYGITGKFFNILRNIYTSDKACVKLENVRSDFFNLSLGVRQGCILSPLLFNIFLSDLAKRFESLEGKFEIGQGGINSLFWADDLVLFAKTEEDLQILLKVLEEYCDENDLVINTKKTKCMIFNKTGRFIRRPFDLNGVKLENVRSYKYLGFVITPSGEIGSGLKDLRDRAFKAFMKLKNDLGVSFNQDIKTTLSLVDTLIKPILLYASDFWGCLRLPKSNPIENLHMMICKQLLGVQKQTTNAGVLLELGRVPLNLFAIKFAIKNWERIKHGHANSFLLASYEDCIEYNLPWTMNIKSILETNGMLNFYINDYINKPPFIHKNIFQRLSDIFHQFSFGNIRANTSKLRTYAILKKDIGFERYLSEIKNVPIRIHMSKFRLSNHRLMIEVGRHNDTPKEKRFCPFCPSKIENEFHFLFECPIYNNLRTNLIEPIMNATRRDVSGDLKIQLLMSNIDTNTCLYIANSMELRSFLLSRPKRLN